MITRMSSKWKLIAANIAVLLLFYGSYLTTMHYSSDDFSNLFAQSSIADQVVLMSYRNFLGAGYKLLSWLGINVVEAQCILGGLMVLIFAYCAMVIAMEIAKRIGQELAWKWIALIDAGAILLFANAFVSEWLWFTLGYIQWAFSVLGCTLGAIRIGRKDARPIDWVIGCCWLILAAGNYQIQLALYAFLVMAFIFLNEEGRISLRAIGHIVKAALAAGIAIAANIGITRLFIAATGMDMASRMGFSIAQLSDFLKQIADAQSRIWINALGLLPKGTFLFFGIALIGLLIAAMKKRSVVTILWVAVCLVSGLAVICLALIMSGSIWIVARVLVPLFAIFSILIWLICFYLQRRKEPEACAEGSGAISLRRVVFSATAVLTVLLFVVNLNSVWDAASDAICSNAIDREYIEGLNQQILQYERENGITVTEIGLTQDQYLTYKYGYAIEQPDYSGEMSIRCMAVEWGAVNSINYFTGRNLQQVEVPETIAAQFSQVNYTTADFSSQLIFDGNRIYVCVY